MGKKILLIWISVLIFISSVSSLKLTLSSESSGYQICFYRGDGSLHTCIKNNETIFLDLHDYYVRLDYSGSEINLLEKPAQSFNILIGLVSPFIVILLVVFTIWGLARIVFR